MSCAEDVRESLGVAPVAFSVSGLNADVRFDPVWLNISYSLLLG